MSKRQIFLTICDRCGVEGESGSKAFPSEHSLILESDDKGYDDSHGEYEYDLHGKILGFDPYSSSGWAKKSKKRKKQRPLDIGSGELCADCMESFVVWWTQGKAKE